VALGVVTNKAFLLAVCQHATFATGKATTAFLSSDLAGHTCLTEAPPTALAVGTAALVVTLEGARGLAEDPSFIGWRSGGPVWSAVHLRHGETQIETRVSAVASGRFAIEWDEDQRVELELAADDGQDVAIVVEGVRKSVAYAVDGDRVWLDDGDGAQVFVNTTYRPAESADAGGSGRLTAPLDGAVTEVAVSVGDVVAKGQLVLVLEAMKMEHRIIADADGKVEALLVGVGQQVKTRQLLAEITVVSAAAS
jgi:geranyl-CoA carboxylase alpha subunit